MPNYVVMGNYTDKGIQVQEFATGQRGAGRVRKPGYLGEIWARIESSHFTRRL